LKKKKIVFCLRELNSASENYVPVVSSPFKLLSIEGELRISEENLDKSTDTHFECFSLHEPTADLANSAR
jgi:hypothetical protein